MSGCETLLPMARKPCFPASPDREHPLHLLSLWTQSLGWLASLAQEATTGGYTGSTYARPNAGRS